MQEKTITILFDPDNFLRSRKNIWSFSNKKFVKIHAIFGAWAIILFIISLSTKDQSSFAFGIISGYLFYVLLRWFGFYERRVKFLNKSRNYAKRFEKEAMACTFTFSENEIEYQDKEKLYKLSWSLFKPYIIFKDSIFLIAKDSSTIVFTINRAEVDNENYSEICDILKDKIGFDKVAR
ncbi:hypothetical protein ACPPVU_05025 [Mucilaginibacter sp. McL0603]|uniref:hypothetical protein n=1 Tax=Mucilaginibacter sp. McL0603 TaxID=3415670 RepID=UPI003CF85E14